jgi:hypothetical protein
MINNLLQMSGRNQLCPFLAVRDLVIAKRFSGGFGTGNSSLYWTGLIADGKSLYFTDCLDLEVISVMSDKQK